MSGGEGIRGVPLLSCAKASNCGVGDAIISIERGMLVFGAPGKNYFAILEYLCFVRMV